MNILPKKFYARDPIVVAQDLLGKILVRTYKGTLLRGRIVETEAYLAEGDEAAHGFKGKKNRNQSLYLDAGHAYVHTMRQYALLDLVTEGADTPSSVLIRAVEPLQGIERMQELRGVGSRDELANGPGKLGIAFAITKELDGIDVTRTTSPLFVEDTPRKEDATISTSGRVGVPRAKDAPLRFWITGNACVSR